MATKKKTTKKTIPTFDSMMKKARARLIEDVDKHLDTIAKERARSVKSAEKLLKSKVLKKDNNFTGKAQEIWEDGRDARVKALKAIVEGKPITSTMLSACEVGCPRAAYDNGEHYLEGSPEGENWWGESMELIYETTPNGLMARFEDISVVDEDERW